MEKKNILAFTIIGVAIIIVIILLFIVNPFSADPPAIQQDVTNEQPQIDPDQQNQQSNEKTEDSDPSIASSNKSKPKPLSNSSDIHIVSEGESLKSIARDVLGDEKMWYKIFLANESTIDWYDTIYVGQKLKLPKVN